MTPAEYVKSQWTHFYTLDNGYKCYGFPSKHGGWVTAVSLTADEMRVATIAGSLMRPESADKKTWGEWHRYVVGSASYENKDAAKEVFLTLRKMIQDGKNIYPNLKVGDKVQFRAHDGEVIRGELIKIDPDNFHGYAMLSEKGDTHYLPGYEVRYQDA